MLTLAQREYRLETISPKKTSANDVCIEYSLATNKSCMLIKCVVSENN